MKEERLRILKMVEEGKISIEEASELLETLEATTAQEKVKGQLKKVKILVEENGKKKVNITLPLVLAKIALKFIPKNVARDLEEEGINLDELLTSLQSEIDKDSPLVNIHEDDTHVLVTLV